jgi:hypothetical protein
MGDAAPLVDTRADRNFNPGNIAYGDFARSHGSTGMAGTDTGHGVAVFGSPEAGFNAMSSLALSKYNGGAKTADDLIAGPHGWTPGKHIAAANVENYMGIKPGSDLNLNDPDSMDNFKAALARQEGSPKNLAWADQDQDRRQDLSDASAPVASNLLSTTIAPLPPPPTASSGAPIQPPTTGVQMPPAGLPQQTGMNGTPADKFSLLPPVLDRQAMLANAIDKSGQGYSDQGGINPAILAAFLNDPNARPDMGNGFGNGFGFGGLLGGLFG